MYLLFIWAGRVDLDGGKSITRGGGGELTSEKVEGEKFTKPVENINTTDYISSLQNSIKHQ
jgi:hypothetical protein